MYDQRVLVINSLAIRDNAGCSGNSVFGVVAARKLSNSLLLKGHNGGTTRVRVANPHASNQCIIRCVQRFYDTPESAFTFLLDGIHAERLSTYLQEFYGKRRTNCSSFAEYMRTGVFRECSEERENLSLSGGMNVYKGQEVRVGDVLAVLYYKRFARSRRIPHIRRHYRKNKKVARLDLRNLRGPELTFSADALFEEFSSGIYADYHFMFCVGRRRGQPVFVQQMGRHTPGETLDGKRAAIVVTLGMTSMGDDRVPAGMLIKRGRG